VEVNVYNADGKKKSTLELPAVFQTPYRPDLIRKAVQAARANRRQPYGAHPMAGKRHATESAGKGRGVSRVPRLTQGNDAALAPPTVGGRRAHPPEARRDWSEKINDKERRLAIKSALAATADPERVKARGHRIIDGLTLPVVVDDDFSKLDKTTKALAFFNGLGLEEELARAYNGRKERAGRGKMRGRRLRQPRSALVVTTDKDAGRRAFGNLSGVDVISPKELNAEHLAPGGDPGRLVVITKSALETIGGGDS
jgi:large subunit ribosomal protein L4e